MEHHNAASGADPESSRAAAAELRRRSFHAWRTRAHANPEYLDRVRQKAREREASVFPFPPVSKVGRSALVEAEAGLVRSRSGWRGARRGYAFRAIHYLCEQELLLVTGERAALSTAGRAYLEAVSPWGERI